MKEFITWLVSVWVIPAALAGAIALPLTLWIIRHDFSTKDKAVGKGDTTQPCFVWLSEKFFLKNQTLMVQPTIKINTLKHILIQSMSLEINKQQFVWNQDDIWDVGESETTDEIEFILPSNIPRGKQLAKLQSLVDGKQCSPYEFIIDLPKI